MLPLGGRDIFHTFPFWAGLIYVTFPLGLLLYGWNDLADVETDRHNPRKDTFLFGARGNAAQLSRLPLAIVVVQVPFLCYFIWVSGWKMALWFGAVFISNILYNAPRFGLKGFPFVDLLNQAGYLLVFLLSSWLNQVPHLAWPAVLFGALFAMHSHLVGQIMDLPWDRRAGRRTTAVVVGMIPAKLLAGLFMLAEAGLLYHFYGDRVLAGFLLLSSLWMVLDGLWLFGKRPYSQSHMRRILLGWNAIAIVSLPWVWYTARLTQLVD